MPIRCQPGVAALALALVACGGGGDPHADGLDPSPDPLSSWSLVRLPRAGGAATRYALPALTAEEWTPRGRLPKLERVIGVDPDLPAVYLLRDGGGVASLDLEAGSVRLVDPAAATAVLGADHTLYTINSAGGATAFVRRTPRALRGVVDGTPVTLAGTVSDRLVVVAATGERRVQVLSADAEPVPESLPDGPVAASDWGDQLAAAGEDELTWWSTRSQERRRDRMREDPQAIVVTPSGHAAWVLAEDARLVRYDRYSGDRREALTLPGPGSALRMDPLGRWLLVRDAAGSGFWVVDPSADSIVTTVRGPWTDNLPTVAGARILLHREGDDLVAQDLAAEGAPEVGRVEGGGTALWAVVPRARVRDTGEQEIAVRPAPSEPETAPDAEAPDSTGVPPEPAEEGTLFLQLSSSRNPEWAEDLARQLRAADVRASVLPASPVDNLYRVVVGPFTTREDAEAVARNLGRPSFIFQRPDGTR